MPFGFASGRDSGGGPFLSTPPKFRAKLPGQNRVISLKSGFACAVAPRFLISTSCEDVAKTGPH